MAWDNAVVTNAGISLLQQVLAGETLTLDKAAGGTGTVPASALMAQIGLKEQKQELPITSVKNVSNGKKVCIQITNVGLASGYIMQQVGIWAHIGNNSPVLFAILQDDTGIAIPSRTEIPDFAMNLYAVINFSNESNFSLSVEPSALVTQGELNERIKNINASEIGAETPEGAQAKAVAAATVVQVELRNHIDDAGVHVTAGEREAWNAKETPAGAQAKADAALADAKQYTDQEVAEVSQAFDAHLAETVIKQNLTINVPADYPTIQAALDTLKYAWIPEDVTVTIQVAAGTYTRTSPIIVDHPCGSQIQIIGATPITTTIMGADTISGSAGNWSVPITVTDVTGIQVGQYAIIRNTSGTDDHFAHRGIWEITAVDAATKTVTVKNTHRASTFPTATLSGGDFIVLTTILEFNNSHGFYFYGNNFGLLDNVAVVGSSISGYDGICLTSFFSEDTLRGANVKLGNNVGVAKFSAGIRVYSGSLIAENVASSSNLYEGFVATEGSSIYAPYSTASGNGDYGFIAQYSGSIDAPYSTASGNGSGGFIAQYSGSIDAPSGTASGNGSGGFIAQYSGSIDAPSGTASGNGLFGFFAQYSSNINASSGTASGNGDYGFYAQYSGSIDAPYSTASGNGSGGFIASFSGSIDAPYSTASGNGSGGFIASFSGSINALYSTASGNATDYKAEKMGYIYCFGYAGTPTFSPAVNTEGNYNAIITT